MKTRFAAPIAWAVGLGLLCARARADGSASALEIEARAARAEAYASLGSMEAAARRARAVLHRARLRGRPAEIGCANEGLSRVDAALRSGREHSSLLVDAWRRGDSRLARGELSRVTLATDAAREASAQAGACIDEPRPPEGTTVRLIVATGGE
jgi:hypothetical protein